MAYSFSGRKVFSDWADFILINIQHPSGKIRQAVVKISSYLLMDLRLDIKFDFDNLKNKDLKREDIRFIVKDNKKKFGNFVMNIEDLLRKYYEPRFNRYKYIQSLPVGIYKSLELLFNEFIRSDYYNNIYQEFLNEFSGNQVTNTANENILNKRQEIEKRFSGLIKYTGSNLGFEDIKNIIYNENGREDLQKIINSFSSVEDFNQLQELVLLTMEAWNYFPHKRLNNLSPMEKV